VNSPTEHEWLRRSSLAALAELPGMGPTRLSAVLDVMAPEGAWQAIARGRRFTGLDSAGVKLQAQWRGRAATIDLAEVDRRYTEAQVKVWSRVDPAYPVMLAGDPWAPAALFAQGEAKALAAERVALIGTRHCTREGRDIARRFGAELAEAGVAVVSGLALGIDGAAHAGALEARCGAPPVAVVGSGLDVVYPRQHTRLWTDVRNSGLILSEAPLGALPEAWRFPARNRIIAALSQVLVVVESHERGGSLITVDQAAERGVDVLAVPGSVRSPASAGSNALLRDGCAPACTTDDILMYLSAARRPGAAPGRLRPAPSPEDLRVLEALGPSLTSTAEMMSITELSLAELATALNRLEVGGWVENSGGWWRRVES